MFTANVGERRFHSKCRGAAALSQQPRNSHGGGSAQPSAACIELLAMQSRARSEAVSCLRSVDKDTDKGKDKDKDEDKDKDKNKGRSGQLPED